MSALPAVVLGHAGGFSWDEALLVLVPLLLLAGLLVLANNRAKKLSQRGEGDGGAAGDASPTASPTAASDAERRIP